MGSADYLIVVAGAAMGVLMTLGVVRGLIAAAGAKLTTRRQAVVAYSAFVFAAIFVSACGAADGGPPNFKDSLYHAALGLIALAVESFYILRQPNFMPPRA